MKHAYDLYIYDVIVDIIMIIDIIIITFVGSLPEFESCCNWGVASVQLAY